MPDPLAQPRPYAPWASTFRATFLLAMGVLVARVLYLWFACPYTLVEDEAFYWTWAVRPELSYYSKGPGIAWLLGLFRGVLGDSAFAVRLPAAILGPITALVLAGFTNDVVGTGDRRPGFLAACCYFLVPMFQVSSLLSTIDGPYALCWIVASWAAWRAFAPRGASLKPWWFVAVAAFIGLGFLFKYTILLLLPGLLAFAWLHRKARLTSARGAVRGTAAWILGSVLVLALALAPVIIWNARNHWPTFSHLLGHAGLPGGDVAPSTAWRYSPLWTLEFIGVQLAAVGPALLLIVLAIVRSRRAWKSEVAHGTRDRFILCCGLPPIVFYLLVTLLTKAQANWALAGYVPLLALAGSLIASGLDEWKRQVAAWRARPQATRVREGFFRRQPETLVQFLWNATVVLGVIIALGMVRLDLVAVAVERLKTTPVVGRFIPTSLNVPIGRFTGADRMGQHATELFQRLTERRPQPPFILTQHYGRAAHLEFYMEGHPRVYCASAFVPGGRRSQYDYWQNTDLRGAIHLLGRDALIVGGYRVEDWLPYFERVELLGRLDGDGKPDRPAFYGFGYRGVEAAMALRRAEGVTASPTAPSAARSSTPLPVYPSAPRAIPFAESPAKDP